MTVHHLGTVTGLWPLSTVNNTNNTNRNSWILHLCVWSLRKARLLHFGVFCFVPLLMQYIWKMYQCYIFQTIESYVKTQFQRKHDAKDQTSTPKKKDRKKKEKVKSGNEMQKRFDMSLVYHQRVGESLLLFFDLYDSPHSADILMVCTRWFTL